ncbi:glycosyl hydrolase 115 family protein [Bacteroides congonensis]|uniref:glycosyl hydrolase 115 family protein n=1 Tax=Bacteroides congonensis TaxID=1871006 RepID=UPI00093220AA|nr:glycosyl hydrolase 115 family protein [Bacteroides congonensis]
MRKSISLLFLLVLIICSVQGKGFILRSGKQVTLGCEPQEGQVVHTALELLKRDCQTVLSSSLKIKDKGGDLIVGTLGRSNLINKVGIDLAELEGKKQAFLLAVSPKGKLVIAGSDSHGTAYGVMELSRLMGVSPWEWWADTTPDRKETFELPANFRMAQAPSVEYRGIFINDEDWGLLPWSNKTYEPSEVKGHIGPRTNERIFELLLRLRANTYWPAMHECTLPFFMTEGNKEAAAKYGVFIGSSHCEPMVCNAAGEWNRRGEGAYNYVTNRGNVYKFWEERVRDVACQNNIYTLGMRGVHDGSMQGARTREEQKAVLKRVIEDQRGLLEKYVSKDVRRVPQVFIPYKEVLDIYNAGLQVPDDVTLMWCDDNYGYIRHFPTEEERLRKGGNGVYYHISYWGRPHDYLWLATTSPALVYQQMKLAFDKGIQKMWILNVGDIKPAEYLIELYMDMAWNLDAVADEGLDAHLCKFLKREFGGEIADSLLPVMKEYYRLAYIRKPEFMGNTREEDKSHYRIIKDLPWSESYIRERLNLYQELSDRVEAIAGGIPERKQDTYFQLIKYPVQASDQMNRKLLKAQLARHGKADWKESDMAYDSIVALTRIYNNEKWNRIMDFRPRRLPVFERVKQVTVAEPMVAERKVLYKWDGAECNQGVPVIYDGLGYERKAAGIKKGQDLHFCFDDCDTDSLEVEVRMLPNHPVNADRLRIAVSLDGGELAVLSYETVGRSEEWKENVLRNQAIRRVMFPVNRGTKHRLVLKALDEGVVLDQIYLFRR